MASHGGGRAFSRRAQAYAFFYPAFALVAAVSFLPLFYAVRQSVHAANYLEIGPFVGLANYTSLLVQGGGFADLGRSVAFVLGSLAVTMPLGVGLAFLLDQPIRFRTFFRTLLMVPWVVSQLVTGLLWMWLYDGRLGPMVGLMRAVGLSDSPLTDSHWAMPSLILTNAWHSYPLVMVFTLAALQTISPEVREAARIDGARAWGRFWHVTLPLIRNTLMVTLVLTTLHTFNTVTTVLIMTGGGPASATDVLALRVFKEGFQFYRTEVASTAAVVIFLLNIAFSFAFIRVLKSERA